MPRKRRLAVNLSRAVQSKHCSLTACAIHVPNLVPEIYPCSSKTPCQSRSHGSVDTRQQYARLQLKGSSDYSDSPRKGTTKSTKEPHPLPHPRLLGHHWVDYEKAADPWTAVIGHSSERSGLRGPSHSHPIVPSIPVDTPERSAALQHQN